MRRDVEFYVCIDGAPATPPIRSAIEAAGLAAQVRIRGAGLPIDGDLKAAMPGDADAYHPDVVTVLVALVEDDEPEPAFAVVGEGVVDVAGDVLLVARLEDEPVTAELDRISALYDQAKAVVARAGALYDQALDGSEAKREALAAMDRGMDRVRYCEREFDRILGDPEG